MLTLMEDFSTPLRSARNDKMGELLQIKNLKISFLRDGEWNEAVHGVSFEVPRGKTLGIVGESGSGKSVSNLAVMRLLNERQSRISADEITLDGKDILHLSENEMHDIRGKRIAMIFQEPMTSLNPVFQCGFQVAEAILAHENVTEEEAKARVISLFKKVMLPRPDAIYKSYPHELSGGGRTSYENDVYMDFVWGYWSCTPRDKDSSYDVSNIPIDFNPNYQRESVRLVSDIK